jgi:hypothetical protein
MAHNSITLGAPYGSLPLSDELVTILEATPLAWFRELDLKMREKEFSQIQKTLDLVNRYSFDTSLVLDLLFKGIPTTLTEVQKYLLDWFEFQIVLTSPFYSVQTEGEEALFNFWSKYGNRVSLMVPSRTYLPIWTGLGDHSVILDTKSVLTLLTLPAEASWIHGSSADPDFQA